MPDARSGQTGAHPRPLSRMEMTHLLRDGVPFPGGVRPAMTLAPMATITHVGFRRLVHEFGGCDLYWTEMISAEALLGGTPYESFYIDPAPVPERTIFQLVGYSRAAIAEAARRIARLPVAGIDLNLGCSAPQIVRKGGGIAWMEREAELLETLRELREVAADKSLSVKVRLAEDGEAGTIGAVCERMAHAGVDFVTLHPKRRREGADREARWSCVAALRSRLPVPVIGNGGIVSWASLQARLRSAGGGPVMIGRGAVRAPWIFSYLSRRATGEIDAMEVDLRATLRRFHELLEVSQPEDFLVTRARRFYPYFFSNLQFGHTVGARLGQSRDYDAARMEAEHYLLERPHVCRRTERD